MTGFREVRATTAKSLVIALLLVPMNAMSRQATHVHGQHEGSPYAGQESREIKALSPDEIAALRKGDGMGFAKAAELNGYPGPRHVLDLAAEFRFAHRHAHLRQIGTLTPPRSAPTASCAATAKATARSATL